jgi:hypothetical protein
MIATAAENIDRPVASGAPHRAAHFTATPRIVSLVSIAEVARSWFDWFAVRQPIGRIPVIDRPDDGGRPLRTKSPACGEATHLSHVAKSNWPPA